MEVSIGVFPDWGRFCRNFDYSAVLPLQPACLHAHSMSGVFSIASHSALQYLPDVIMQEQTGCAHLCSFSVAISFLHTFTQCCQVPQLLVLI
jgi:hypothetical protein